MKDVIVTFLRLLAPVLLFGSSAYLIYHQAPGWGWHLFAVVLFTTSMSGERK